MLTKLKIKNFKGIQTCKVSDLRKINLFIGKNDSGKSAMLEAAYYSLKEHYSPILQDIMDRRTDVFTGGIELWFKYETRHPIVLSTWVYGTQLNLTLRMRGDFVVCELSGIGARDPKTRTRPKWKFTGSQYGGKDFSFSTGVGKPIEHIPLKKKTRNRLDVFIPNMSLMDCTLKSKTSIIEARLGELKIAGKDKEFGIMLEDTYGKGKDWEFLPHKDRLTETRLAFRESGRLTFFSDFGDGLRYGLGILGTAMSSQNTAFFIEEIESHQHSGSLRKLIRHLVEIARKNHLQIFLSTHCYGVWESLARGVYIDDVEREKKEFRCFLVERDEETGKTTAESTDDVHRITTTLGGP